jgi:hypothetical protein
MKKFLFSLFIGLIIAGLSYAATKYNTVEELKFLQQTNQKIHSQTSVIKIENLIQSKSWLPTNFHDGVFNGFLTFILLWVFLAIILGIKGFFSDFKAFFPLRA